MITKIRVSNLYSIDEEIELKFLKGGTKEEEGFFSYRKDKKISLINGFFGANASGKSNVLKSIVGVIRMIYTFHSPQNNISSGGIANEPLLFHRNAHKKFDNKLTKLGIDFLFGNNYYIYDLELKEKNSIKKEKLSIINLDKKSAKPKEIFNRIDSTINLGPEYREYEVYSSKINIEKYQTFISHLINIGAKAVIDFIDRKDSFFLKIDSLDATVPSQIAILSRVAMLNSYSEEKRKEFLRITKDMMNCFDDSIEEIIINTENNNISVKIRHKNFSENIDIMQESAGTRELFSRIFDILNAFKKGGVVVYDETNRYYHPDVELALLSIFKNKEFNTKNAQLFFASHNHETFDLLELDQVHIVEKIDSCSSIYKLSEVEDLKKRDNLKKKYRLGMLGGTPDVADFDYKLKKLL